AEDGIRDRNVTGVQTCALPILVTLGRFFRREVTIMEGQAIVRRGPYRLIRHPAYLGTIIVVLGLGLAIGGWMGAVVAAAIEIAEIGRASCRGRVKTVWCAVGRR